MDTLAEFRTAQLTIHQSPCLQPHEATQSSALTATHTLHITTAAFVHSRIKHRKPTFKSRLAAFSLLAFEHLDRPSCVMFVFTAADFRIISGVGSGDFGKTALSVKSSQCAVLNEIWGGSVDGFGNKCLHKLGLQIASSFCAGVTVVQCFTIKVEVTVVVSG